MSKGRRVGESEWGRERGKEGGERERVEKEKEKVKERDRL